MSAGFTVLWGPGVHRDYTEAAKWHRKTAEQGNSGRFIQNESELSAKMREQLSRPCRQRLVLSRD